MWTWIIVIASILVVLIMTPLLVGRFLPKQFSTVTQLRIRRTPQAVWDAIGDYQKLPISARMHRATEVLPDVDGRPAWRENIGSSRIRIETIEADAPSRLVRQFQDEVVPMRLRMQYDIEPADDGSLVRCTANGTVDNGTWHAPFFRFMIHVFGGAKSGQKQYLASVAKHFDEKPRFQE